MEERWETRIHTLDVGQGDSSIIQISKLRKLEIRIEPEDYLERYEEELLTGYKAGSARRLPVIYFYHFEEEEIIDVLWEYNILIDGGEEGQEEKILHSINQNIKFCLDAVIITHADSDHYGGVYAMLAKNNFWHLCKVIYFTVGQGVIAFLNNLEPSEEPDSWKKPTEEWIRQAVEEIVSDLLIFTGIGKIEQKKFFISKFIDGIWHIINKLIYKKDGFENFMEEMKHFFKDEKENEYAVKFLYRELMKDVEIRSAVGTGLEKEGDEIQTKLPSNLPIYMSELAYKALFSGEEFKEQIYTGRRMGKNIAIREGSKYSEKYGVNRTIIKLSVGDINMDFMAPAADRLELEIVPVRMVLAAVDQYADPRGKMHIGGRDTEKIAAVLPFFYKWEASYITPEEICRRRGKRQLR